MPNQISKVLSRSWAYSVFIKYSYLLLMNIILLMNETVISLLWFSRHVWKILSKLEKNEIIHLLNTVPKVGNSNISASCNAWELVFFQFCMHLFCCRLIEVWIRWLNVSQLRHSVPYSSKACIDLCSRYARAFPATDLRGHRIGLYWFARFFFCKISAK